VGRGLGGLVRELNLLWRPVKAWGKRRERPGRPGGRGLGGLEAWGEEAWEAWGSAWETWALVPQAAAEGMFKGHLQRLLRT